MIQRFKKSITVVVIISLGYLGMVRCFGSFALTKKLHGLVDSIENKWVKQIVFIVLVWLVGVLAFISIALDMLIFNLIEFWSGKNVLAHQFDKNGEHKKIVEKGNEKAIFIYKKFGSELELELYKDGTLLKTLAFKKNQPGVFYSKNNGQLDRIQVQEETRGSEKVITILEGDRVVSRKSLSFSEYAQMLRRGDNLLAANPATSGSL